MIRQMTSLEEKVWAHVYAVEYHWQGQHSPNNAIEDARQAEVVADAAVENLRALQPSIRTIG